MLKLCQYPVRMCFGRLPGGGFVGPLEVVPDTVAPYGEQLPAASQARTLKLYVVLGLSPVAVQLVTLPTLCAASVPRTTSYRVTPFASEAADQFSCNELEVGLPTVSPPGVVGAVVSGGGAVPPGPSSTTSSAWYAGRPYHPCR